MNKSPSPKIAEESAKKNEEGALNSESWSNSSYELLRREGELHLQGSGDILQEIRKNVDDLEELHGRLNFMMSEVQSLIRR